MLTWGYLAEGGSGVMTAQNGGRVFTNGLWGGIVKDRHTDILVLVMLCESCYCCCRVHPFSPHFVVRPTRFPDTSESLRGTVSHRKMGACIMGKAKRGTRPRGKAEWGGGA